MGVASYPNLALLLERRQTPEGELDCKKLAVQGCQLAYNLKHPDALVTGALAKTGADLLLRSLSRRSRSAATDWPGP